MGSDSLKKKLAPKNKIDPPSAKRNAAGQLVTNKTELEELYLDTYVQRLTPNPAKKDLEEIVKFKDILFNMRIESPKKEVTEDWTVDELKKSVENFKE